MSPISDSLPEAQRKQYLLAELRPGCVIRLQMKFPEGPRHKFLVLVADDDPEYWSFIINSNIHPFVQARPHLLKCQVSVDAAAHPFLQYDSHLACHKIEKLRKEEIIHELMQDMSGLQGQISESAREHVCAAVKFATTLSPREKQLILDAFC